jgi:hypothetical protein
MTPSLLASITSYKDYFLVISGTYGDRVLTVLDRELGIVSELDFSGVQMWEEAFHIDEAASKVLISVTTSDTFPIESKTYQGFHTLWYELNETADGFQLDQIDQWERSDIKYIKSKPDGDERVWVCLRDLSALNQLGNWLPRTSIGIAYTTGLEVPEFKYAQSNEHNYLSQSFDFEVTASDILLSGIGRVSHDVPTLVRISRNRKNMEFLQVDLPLRKNHEFRDTVFKRVNGQLFAYFWIVATGSCKKYRFEIYAIEINDRLSQSTFIKALDADFAHPFRWNNSGKVAFNVGMGKSPCLVGRIGDKGVITDIEELEVARPVHISDSDEIVALLDDGDKGMITMPAGKSS